MTMKRKILMKAKFHYEVAAMAGHEMAKIQPWMHGV